MSPRLDTITDMEATIDQTHSEELCRDILECIDIYDTPAERVTRALDRIAKLIDLQRTQNDRDAESMDQVDLGRKCHNLPMQQETSHADLGKKSLRAKSLQQSMTLRDVQITNSIRGSGYVTSVITLVDPLLVPLEQTTGGTLELRNILATDLAADHAIIHQLCEQRPLGKSRSDFFAALLILAQSTDQRAIQKLIYTLPNTRDYLSRWSDIPTAVFGEYAITRAVSSQCHTLAKSPDATYADFLVSIKHLMEVGNILMRSPEPHQAITVLIQAFEDLYNLAGDKPFKGEVQDKAQKCLQGILQFYARKSIELRYRNDVSTTNKISIEKTATVIGRFVVAALARLGTTQHGALNTHTTNELLITPAQKILTEPLQHPAATQAIRTKNDILTDQALIRKAIEEILESL